MIAETVLRYLNGHNGPIKMRVANSVRHNMIVEVDKRSLMEEIQYAVAGNISMECGLFFKTKDGTMFLSEDDRVWERDNHWAPEEEE